MRVMNASSVSPVANKPEDPAAEQSLSMDLVVSKDEVPDLHNTVVASPTKSPRANHRGRVRVRSWSSSSLDTAPTTSEEDESEVSVRDAEWGDSASASITEDSSSAVLPRQREETETEIIEEEEEEESDDNQSDDSKLFERLVFKALHHHNVKKPKSVRFLLDEEGPLVHPFKPFPPKLTAAEAQQREQDRRVRFGELTIHEFGHALGDHPDAGPGGPPLRLDYDDSESITYTKTVDGFEWNRGRRRCLQELRVPPHTRRFWLLKAKHGTERHECALQMEAAEAEAQRVQRQRAWSRALAPLEGSALWRESLKKSVQKVVPGGSKNTKGNEVAAKEWNRQYKREQKQQRRQGQVHKKNQPKTVSAAA